MSSVVERTNAPRLTYAFTCYKADGSVRWQEEIENLVTTVGKNDLLTQYFKGAAYTAAWFCGLISSVSYTTGPDAGDTAASHPGWTENVTYAEATRPAITFGTAAGGSLAASAESVFNITGAATLKGAFTISNSTKGGATGILYSAALFSTGDRGMQNGDTLNVTVTMQAT